MVKGIILVAYTDQGRRAIKDSPDRADASKAEATKLGSRSKTFSIRQVDRMMLQLSSRRRGPWTNQQAHVEHPVVRQHENEIYPGFLDRGDAQDGLSG
jgi:hypothetical protein